MSQQNIAIVGNALAGMVASLELANQGHIVSLINPGGPMGGYFAGLEIDGVTFDAGLVKFELDGYLNQANDLSTYDPKKRNDIGRFMNVVHEWAESYTPLHQFDMPKMWLENKAYDDIILSNSYHTFKDLPFAEASIGELKASKPDAAIHAKQKVTGDAYQTLDYLTASVANHGQTFHDRVIAPYLYKAQHVTADKMLARYHRVAWLPLFYPETMLDSLQGNPVPLNPTVFHYPKSGCISSIVKQVLEEIKQHPNIRMMKAPVTRLMRAGKKWNVAMPNEMLNVDRLAWTGAPAALLTATGHQVHQTDEIKSAIALLFLRISRKDIIDVYTLMHVLDLDKAAYRITNQTASEGNMDADMNIVVEFNQDYFNEKYGIGHDDDSIAKQLLSELADMNMVKPDAVPQVASIKRVPGGFLVPDAAARDAWEADQQQVSALFPDIGLLAMSSGFFATSLNDQVIQGLHYAKQMENNKDNLAYQVDLTPA